MDKVSSKVNRTNGSVTKWIHPFLSERHPTVDSGATVWFGPFWATVETLILWKRSYEYSIPILPYSDNRSPYILHAGPLSDFSAETGVKMC